MFDIAQYVEDNLSNVIPSGNDERAATCPERSCGKDGGFYINVETGAFICFKCDFRGKNVAGLIAEVEGVSYVEARKRLLLDAMKSRRTETPTTLSEKVRRLRRGADSFVGEEDESFVDAPLPDEYVSCFSRKKSGEEVWRVPKYLSARGFSRETIRRFRVGYADLGRYGSRVILPIECPNGRSFTARDTTGLLQPRYLNPKGVDHGRLLFGWPTLDREADFVVVEGPFDALKMAQNGYRVVSILGKVLHADQYAMIRDAKLGTPTVLLDGEEGRAPLDVADKLLGAFSSVYIARLPSGIDPGEASPEVVKAAMRSAVRYRGERSMKMAGALSDMKRRVRKFF